MHPYAVYVYCAICKIGQWFYEQIEIQTFIALDPEGETQ